MTWPVNVCVWLTGFTPLSLIWTLMSTTVAEPLVLIVCGHAVGSQLPPPGVGSVAAVPSQRSFHVISTESFS